MASWCTLKLSYEDWQRSYKRDIGGHDHGAAGQFVADALENAYEELHATYEDIQQNEITQGDLRVYMENDPGDNYREI